MSSTDFATHLPAAQRDLTVAQPVLTTKDGRATTNSLDVAAFFGKAHRDVLKAVDKLLADAPACLRNFAQGSYTRANTGEQQHRCFDMDRTGFTLLAMGFTGATALHFKLTYVTAFDAMEERLKTGQIDFNDPAALRRALLSYSERTEVAEARVAVLEPKAEAFENLANPTLGNWTPTDTARALGVTRDRLIADLLAMRWVFRKPGRGDLAGYADAVDRGLVDHRQHVWTDRYGVEHASLQVDVTPLGRQRLSLHYTSRAGTLLERRSPAALPAPASLIQ